MKGIGSSKTVMMCVGFFATLFLLLGGCAHFNTDAEEESADFQDKGFAPPIYYDFGDVRLPEELKVNNKASFVYRTSGFSAGVLVLEGSVEMYSLISFFENSMSNEKWEFVSSFKSPRTIMIFKKEGRWCIISITERKFSTLVEIWVAPTISEDSTGLISRPLLLGTRKNKFSK